MEFKDYYKVLGVERTADQKAISRAFRKLARQHHPDVNPGNAQAEGRFKEINEAYQVLNDPERRSKYDQLLDLRQHGGGWEELLRQRGAGAPGDGTYTVYTEGTPEDLGQFSDFFQQLFGGAPFGARGRGGRGSRRSAGGPSIEDLLQQGASAVPRDVEGVVEISLEEAYHGATRTVTIPGDGSEKPRTIEVKIPKGVASGQRIRAAGQAHGGDLYLVVQVQPHPVFTRQEHDLLCEAAVPVWTAALGGQVHVPTLSGTMMMTIPAGTREGQTFRLRGQGMPHLRGSGAGDELVKVRLALPEPLTPRDRELFEEMRRLHEPQAATSQPKA